MDGGICFMVLLGYFWLICLNVSLPECPAFPCFSSCYLSGSSSFPPSLYSCGPSRSLHPVSASSVSLLAPLCPIWLSQVQAKILGPGPRSGLGPQQNNNWPWRVRRVSVSIHHSARWLWSVCLSACLRFNSSYMWKPLNTGWFSYQENRGLHLCQTKYILQ